MLVVLIVKVVISRSWVKAALFFGAMAVFPAGLEAFAAEVIPFSRRVAWQGNAGVTGGIPDSANMVIFTNFTSSVTRDQVQTALQRCPSNQVVRLAAGIYNWTGDLDWYGVGNGKVLKGSVDANGNPATIIRSPSSISYMRAQFCESCMGTEVNLTSDGRKGDTTISVTATPSWAKIGEVIGIDQLDDPALSINPGQESGTSYRQLSAAGSNGARGMGQLIRVVATTPTSITFETPLAWTFSTGFTAQIFKPGHDPAVTGMRKRCGIENLVWEHTGSANSANHMFRFENAEDCWLKNVHGTNMVGGVYVFGMFSYRCEIRHCRFENSKQQGSGSGYGVGLYYWCTGWLVEDNIFRKLHVAMQNNYGSSYNVFSYNFETDGESDSGQNPGFNAHGTTGYMCLVEGNWLMDKVNGDFTHGAGALYTVFRNRVLGKNPSQVNDQSAISIERYERKWNVVGNIAGQSGWHKRSIGGLWWNRLRSE